MLVRMSLSFLVGVIVALAVIALGSDDGFGDTEAEAAALRWVGTGESEGVRRDGGQWEVDVLRPDGSLVEVTLGSQLELRGFDEERGPRRTLAPDELRGAERDRAIRAALAKTGPGRVLGAERDSSREIEVSVRRAGGDFVEVELDASLRVVEIEPEDPSDE
jgi:hypothetical protein